MSVVGTAIWLASCWLVGQAICETPKTMNTSDQALAQSLSVSTVSTPVRVADSLDVVLTAQAALSWDVASGAVLYERNSTQRRPVASLSKLASTLVIRKHLSMEQVVEVPAAAAIVQRLGAHIRLPVGHHVTVHDLLAAGLIASANDAMVTLAHAVRDDEASFAALVNESLPAFGILDTQVANATGLSKDTQYSTARDVQRMLMLLYQDEEIAAFLRQSAGQLTTQEEVTRSYKSTNDLLDTYLPIQAAKTGYTYEAKENVAVITTVEGREVGIVILGSDQRFQDAKILAEWIERQYDW